MEIGVVTLFPEMFEALQFGIAGRALSKALTLETVQLRDFSDHSHGYIDDRPFGGGPGMVIRAEPVYRAVEYFKKRLGKRTKVIYTSPSGAPITQQRIARFFTENEPLVFICGRYEGIDQRVISATVDEVWSVSEMVCSGGELPVMCIIDAIARCSPGGVSNPESLADESFEQGRLEPSLFTRPACWREDGVPAVYRAGHHEQLFRHQLCESLLRTLIIRPDMLFKRGLTTLERRWLLECIAQVRSREDDE